MRVVASILLLASAFLLGLGITQPLMRFERLFVFNDTPSLIDIIVALYSDGDALLALVVGCVSIVFPIAKITLMQTLVIGTSNSTTSPPRWAGWLGHLSKWSMMDVVLVALAIFAAKTSGLAQAISQPGLWFYGSSALLGAVASTLARKAPGGTNAASRHHQ